MRAGTQMNSHNKHKPSRDESVGHEIDVRHVKEVGNGKQLFQDSAADRDRDRDFGEVRNARLSPATNITYCPLRSDRQPCSPTTPFPEVGLLHLLFLRRQHRTAEREFTRYLPVYPLDISIGMVFDATRVDTTQPKLSTNLNGWLLVAVSLQLRLERTGRQARRHIPRGLHYQVEQGHVPRSSQGPIRLDGWYRDARRHIDMTRTSEFDRGLKHDFS